MTDTALQPRPPEGDWLGTPYLRLERRGSIAVVTVDRPEARNAMTPSMYFGIRYAVDHVDREPDLAGLLITGTGDVFIPGGDLGGDNRDGWADLPRLLGMDNTPFEAIRRSVKPVVCAVNGLAQGGGLMIAMLSDVTVASERATFRSPELFRGIADTNYAQVLPRQIGPARARDMLLTGRDGDRRPRRWSGASSRGWCRTTSCSPRRWTRSQWCCRTAPGACAEVKRSFDRYYGTYDRMGMDASLNGAEPVEGFHAFKERRNPNWVAPDLDTGGRI